MREKLLTWVHLLYVLALRTYIIARHKFKLRRTVEADTGDREVERTVERDQHSFVWYKQN